MSATNAGEAWLLQLRNHHAAASGPPPHIDDRSPSQYLGYFENQYGEQAIFVYDHDSSQAVLYLGDAGWETSQAVIDGAVPELVLSETERLWLRACWQAATTYHKEV